MTSSQQDPQDIEKLYQSEARFRLLVDSIRDYAIFMLDPNGSVLTWNAGAERFTGYKATEIIGKHFSRFYTADALARHHPEYELKMASKTGTFEEEAYRVRKDGSQFWANVVITAMRDPSGKLMGFAKVTRDLTQRRAHDEALRQSEERFRLLVEGVSEYAIFLLDVNGRVATWNQGAQRIKGYAAEEIIGEHFSKFYPVEVRDSGWPAHELAMAEKAGSFIDTGWRVRKDGTMFWASVKISALRDHNGRLLGYTKLTRDMTEQKRSQAMEVEGQEREHALAAERSARIAAQQAMRMKDEFLAMLSHELRTPLSAILGWTQLLLRSLPDPAPAGAPASASTSAQVDQRRGIEVIERNAKAQVQLIDDLLDLSRIMTGKLRLELRQVHIHEAVESAVDSARPMAEAKNIRLITMLDAHRAVVSADSGRLQQVVWNLLTNAIKFTPSGGQVQVLLQRVNSHIEISVSDTGIGISPSFLPQVFQRFSQQDSSSTRGHGGLGLGLAICKQLVELHGGIIRVYSEGEGRGSTFAVQLPLSIVQSEDDGSRTHPSVEIDAGDNLALPRLAGVHAFIVDDEPDARDLLKRILEGQGMNVTAFASGQEVLDALKSHRPTVLISDIGMPGMDGHQMMRTLRAIEPRGSRLPALALTAFARSEDRKRSLLAGYQAHISKPFDVGELVLSLASLIAG